MSNEKIVVTEIKNDVVVSSPGPQGPRGKTILNGTGAPSNAIGLEGDFYYDKNTTRFYGPKLNSLTWEGAANYLLSTMTLTYPWMLNQVTGPLNGVYSLQITHNLGYNPNVTIKNSAGDLLETGIDTDDGTTIFRDSVPVLKESKKWQDYL